MTELVSIDFIDADTYTDLAQELAPKWRTTTDAANLDTLRRLVSGSRTLDGVTVSPLDDAEAERLLRAMARTDPTVPSVPDVQDDRLSGASRLLDVLQALGASTETLTTIKLLSAQPDWMTTLDRVIAEGYRRRTATLQELMRGAN